MKRDREKDNSWQAVRQVENWPKHRNKHNCSRNKDMTAKIITQPIIQTVTKSVRQESKQPYVISCVFCQLPSVACVVIHPPLYPPLLSISLCFSLHLSHSLSPSCRRRFLWSHNSFEESALLSQWTQAQHAHTYTHTRTPSFCQTKPLIP